MNHGSNLWRIVTRAIATVATAVVVASAHPVQAGIDIWTRLGLEGEQISALAIDPATPTTPYGVTAAFNVGSRVFKSTHAGATWNATELTRPDIRALAIDPVTPRTLYAGTDGGDSWNGINAGLTASVQALVIDPRSPSRLYSGTDDGVFSIEQIPPCVGDCTPTATPTGALPTPSATGSPRVASVGTGTADSCTDAALDAASPVEAS